MISMRPSAYNSPLTYIFVEGNTIKIRGALTTQYLIEDDFEGFRIDSQGVLPTFAEAYHMGKEGLLEDYFNRKRKSISVVYQKIGDRRTLTLKFKEKDQNIDADSSLCHILLFRDNGAGFTV